MVALVAFAVAAIAAITWMPYCPVWSLIYVAIAVMVIYGLAAHFDKEAVTEASRPPVEAASHRDCSLPLSPGGESHAP
jgi:hypothetical protein